MSSFASKYYEKSDTTKDYALLRIPVGLPLITGSVLYHRRGIKLEEAEVLDAGCGIGNYCVGLKDLGFRKFNLIEPSEAMLNKALDRLGDTVGKVVQATLPSALDSFADNSIDLILTTQVLHHVPTEEMAKSADFSIFKEIFKGYHRVLHPGGVVFIDLLTGDSSYPSFVTKFCSIDIREYYGWGRFPTSAQVVDMLEGARLKVASVYKNCHETLSKEASDPAHFATDLGVSTNSYIAHLPKDALETFRTNLSEKNRTDREGLLKYHRELLLAGFTHHFVAVKPM